eukprot:880945-Prorocentrum_minimum.AAC.1
MMRLDRQQKVDQANQAEMERGSPVTAALKSMKVRPLLTPSSPPPRPLLAPSSPLLAPCRTGCAAWLPRTIGFAAVGDQRID